MSVVTVTLNPCIDKTCTVERMVPEDKLSAKQVREYPGGGGINVARVITRLGESTCALWSGGGPNAQLLSQLLDEERVSHRLVPLAGNVRENIIITDASEQHQYRIGMPGQALADDAVPAWLEALSAACTSHTRYVAVSGSLAEGSSLAAYAALLDAVPKNARLIVDSKGEALQKALDFGTFLIKPNYRELQQLTGHQLDEPQSVVRAAKEVVAGGGAEVVLVSLGAEGAMLVTADGAWRLAAPDVDAVSKVGAGDSMLGGVISGLLRDYPLQDAVRLGVAAGTAAVMSEGTELCSRENTELLYPRVTAKEGI